MAEPDVTRIAVANFSVGIVGLRQVMQEIADSHAGKSDEEIRSIMLESLERNNYIPANSRDAYGTAFVREFRKFLGAPCTDDSQQRLDVKVLGMGCAQCHSLTQTVMEVLAELKLAAGVEHITDLGEIARYGIMGSPALLINDRAVAVGSIPPREKIRKWLSEANAGLKA